MHQFPFFGTNKLERKQNKYAESGKMKIQEESATGFPVQNCSFLLQLLAAVQCHFYFGLHKHSP